ncbi:MAG: hypothetical protein ACSHWW_08180 [Nonlabens sp.]|uniref:hypothetical protein n=1 Tax=Nonlabens sp. TaxID=1888209 RepID=UPI003EF76256
MKTINKYFLIAIAVASLMSCGGDDDVMSGSTTSTNGITIEGNFTPALKAFVVFERNAPFEDAFSVILSDGDLINDINNEFLIETTTSVAAVLFYDTNGASVATESQVNLGIGNYTLDVDTTVIDGIQTIPVTATQSGMNYGDADSLNSTEYVMQNTGTASLNITAITKDFITRTGTITFTFNMIDDFGHVISGSYTGSYKMLKGDV